jgi:hypothetical protein
VRSAIQSNTVSSAISLFFANTLIRSKRDSQRYERQLTSKESSFFKTVLDWQIQLCTRLKSTARGCGCDARSSRDAWQDAGGMRHVRVEIWDEVIGAVAVD